MSINLWYEMVQIEQDQHGGNGDNYDESRAAERRINSMSREQFVNRLEQALESRYGLTPKED